MTPRSLFDRFAAAARRLDGGGWIGRGATAALLALLAASLASWHLRRTEAALRARFAPFEIVAAARDLPEATLLAAGDLRVVGVPREALPGGALVPAALSALEGRRLLVSLRMGDPLLASVVAHSGGARPLARDLTPGRRAVAIPVDPATAVAGFVEPGDRVDVVLVWQEAGGEGRAATLLEALPVLAVGERRLPGAAPLEAATAVLEADPAEAEALLLALDRGRLALVLRPEADIVKRGDRRTLSLAPLLPGYRPPAAAARSVEVIHGVR